MSIKKYRKSNRLGSSCDIFYRLPHIETVPTALAGEWSHEQGVGLTLIINEEGKLLGMPVNRLATDMAYLFNDAIVGNAILIGTTDEDFIGLTKEAAENIMEKWR